MARVAVMNALLDDVHVTTHGDVGVTQSVHLLFGVVTHEAHPHAASVCEGENRQILRSHTYELP